MLLTQILAATAAFSLFMLALLHGLVWRLDRQRWAALFTVGLGTSSLYYALDPWLKPSGERANPAGSVVGALVIFSMLLGMMEYVQLPRRAQRWLVGLGVGLGLPLLALRLGGVLPRLGGMVVYACYFMVFAGLAAWAMRREPRRGHGLVLAALMTYPLAVAGTFAGLIPTDLLRYVIVVPSVMLGMAVLTTGQMRKHALAEEQLRRRREVEVELRRLNDSLEHRVAERTAELQGMVVALESFNRSVSHDLRGPLGGMSHLLRVARERLDRGDIDKVRQILDVVAQQADDSGRLVQALLTLARAGTGELQPRTVALRALVDEALAQLRAEAGDADQALPVVLHDSLPATVDGDPGLLRQVFVNLIGNALKFSAGQAVPSVEVGAEVQAGAAGQPGRPVLFVRDNGVGFATEDLPRLFTPFQRLHGPAFAGSGVGLSIVRRIVERHGGRLWAESEPGRGATFRFTLEPDAVT